MLLNKDKAVESPRQPAPSSEAGEEWITPAEASSKIGVTRQTLYQYWFPRYSGLARKVGGRWRVSAGVLADILNGNPPPEKAIARTGDDQLDLF